MLNASHAPGGRASARKSPRIGAQDGDRVTARATGRRSRGGNARQSTIHGRASAISGAAAVSSSRRWIICAQNSLPVSASTGGESAIRAVSSPA